MGVKERRERQKEMLRQEILDAARELFVKEGYENVSMRKVAEKIEYSPTTIYLYFEDKADLLYCLCEETFTLLLDSLRKMKEENCDPLDCLRKLLRNYVDFGLNNPNHYKVTFITHHENPERFLSPESTGQQVYLQMRMIVEECIKRREIREMDICFATQGLWSAVHGITSLLIMKPHFPWMDRDRLIDHVIETSIAGLMPQAVATEKVG